MNKPAMAPSAEKTVAQVMSSELVTLKIDDTLRLADDMLNLAHVRHFPVLDGAKLAGAIDQDDLLHASMASLVRRPNHAPREVLGAVSVKEVMKPAVTVAPDTPISVAARTMVDKEVDFLLVTEADRLIGLVTRTDLLRQMAAR
jgi:CBS domain-containing membrane protein